MSSEQDPGRLGSLMENELLARVAAEFLVRYRRGERPSIEEYASRHPEIAGEIRRTLEVLVAVEQGLAQAGPGASAASPTRAAAGAGSGQGAAPAGLGEYRILREVGRGGMGIVYEAEQASLGRRVALKVLALRDPRSVRRFRREARAAARLHHTNIVPVFEVGQDGATCFYTMQFIDGQSLDAVLGEVRRLRGRPDGADPVTTVQLRPGPKPAVAAALLTGQFQVRDLVREEPPGPGSTEPFVVGPAASPTTEPLPGEAPAAREPEPSTDPAPSPPAAADPPAPAAVGLPAPSPGTANSGVLSGTGTEGSPYYRSVARVGRQVAQALAYAHARGVLHRDIKPSNLLMDEAGVVWVSDFGLARAEGDETTQGGDLAGTLRYMAPERFRGEGDGRADVYALGLTLYEMLVLRPAFVENDRARLIEQIREGRPPRPRELDPRIPRDLETIVLKAIEKEPGQRYATAEQMAEDLRRFLADEPIRARRVGLAEQTWRWCRRNRLVAGLLGLVVMLVLVLTVGSMVAAVRLRRALTQANEHLWESHAAEARAHRMSGRPGQRFATLAAVAEALRLPAPAGRSREELRQEAVAALLLPDLAVARTWDGWPVGSAGFAMDEEARWYARGDKDGTVTVRRVADDGEVYQLPGEGPASEYGGLRFAPGGRFLTVISLPPGGPLVRLWRIDGPEPALVLEQRGHAACFRPDGRQVVVSGLDGRVVVHDCESGEEVRRLMCGYAGMEGWVLWNPRRPLLFVGSRGAWRVVDAEDGRIRLETAVPGQMSSADWHPAGRLLAIAGNDQRIYLWDVDTGRPARPPLEGHKTRGLILRFNRTGSRLASSDWSGMLRVWDVGTGRTVLTHPQAGPYLDFRAGDTLVAADLAGPQCRLLRWRSGDELRTVAPQPQAGLIPWGRTVLSPDGRLAAVPTNAGVALVDVVRGEEVALVPLTGNAPLRFEEEARALVTYGAQGQIRLPIAVGAPGEPWRVGPPEPLSPVPTPDLWGASADGTVLAVPAYNQGAQVWRGQPRQVLHLGPQEDVRFCAVSPDGRWVATGSHRLREGPGARVWDAVTGQAVAELPVGGLCRLGFSPDGRWLVTTGGGYRLWRVGDWVEGPRIDGVAQGFQFAFSPDSRWLAVGGEPGVIRLIDVATGREVVSVPTPEAVVLHPQAFTPDGSRLVVAALDSGALLVVNLAAVRLGLRELGLDWDGGPLPAEGEASDVPLDVRVTMGTFLAKRAAARLKHQAGEHLRARRYREAMAALRGAVRADPEDAWSHNDLAWLLATGPAELRNPGEALPLARRAVALDSKRSMFRNTLGVVLYRAGQAEEAVAELERSLQGGQGATDAFDLFFLAMCHQKRGRPGEARVCFERGRKWVQERQGKLPPRWLEELAAFEAEARAALPEVLGMPVEAP